MLASATFATVFAIFNLGDGEIILVLLLILLGFGAKKFPDLGKGLGQGLFEFWKTGRRMGQELDEQAHDAGASLGGIYGKPAAQALTPDNQVSELYDPAAFHKPESGRSLARGWCRRLHKLLLSFWNRLCSRIFRIL